MRLTRLERASHDARAVMSLTLGGRVGGGLKTVRGRGSF
jgi:hypothetical protein